MFKKKWIKISGIVLASVITILFVLSFLITYFVNKKLPEIIAEKNDTAYGLTYKDLSFSIFTNSLSIQGIEVFPKNPIYKADSISKIKEIDVVGINIMKLLKKKEFSALKLKIHEPDFYYYPIKENEDKHKKTNFGKNIDVNRIEIKKGKFSYYERQSKDPKIKVDDIDVLFTGVNFDTITASKKIPFHYNDFQFKIDTVFYKINEYQFIVLNDLELVNKQLNFLNYKLKSTDLKDNQKYKANNLDVDLFDIEAPSISFVNTDWGFNNQDQLFITVDKINVKNPDINIIPTSNKKAKSIHKHLESTNIINVNDLNIEGGKFKLWHANGARPKLSIDDVACNFEGIKLNNLTKEKEIPVDYKSFNINLNDLYFELNESQYAKASAVKFSKNDFLLSDFHLKPLINSSQFLNSATTSNVLLDVKSPSVEFLNNDFGFKNNEFYFNINNVKIDEVEAQIVAEKKNLPTKKVNKHLININSNINQIQINSAKVFSKNKFLFDNFSVSFQGLQNDMKKGVSVNKILVKNPNLVFYKQPKKKEVVNKKEKKFLNSSFDVKNIQIENGNLQLTKNDKTNPEIKLNNFRVNFSNVVVDSSTINKVRPFNYSGVVFDAKSVNYDLSKDYELNTNEWQFTNGNLAINQIKLTPKLSRNAFVSSLQIQEDLYNVTVKKLTGKNVDMGLDENKKFYFNSDNLSLINLYADIFRSQVPPPNTKIKTMFSEKLRDLKFGLNLKNVNLVNSTLVYGEEGVTSNGVGKLTFSNINTNIKNFNSGFQKTTLPDVIVNWNSDFMGANMAVLWTFNPMNTAEDFTISGSIKNMQGPNLDPFLIPYLKISAQGNFNEINFDFAGDNLTAKGLFDIKYYDLYVDLWKNNGKERKFFTAIGNALISKHTKADGKQVHIKEVKRNQEKSFFNFFLACILEGLKETILII